MSLVSPSYTASYSLGSRNTSEVRVERVAPRADMKKRRGEESSTAMLITMLGSSSFTA